MKVGQDLEKELEFREFHVVLFFIHVISGLNAVTFYTELHAYLSQGI